MPLEHERDEQRRDTKPEHAESIDIQAEQRVSNLAPADAVAELMPLLDQFDLARERAIRGWVASDPVAAAVVSRVDESRFEILLRVWERTLPPEQARAAALLPHLFLIGAVSAGTTRADLVQAIELLAEHARHLDPG